MEQEPPAAQCKTSQPDKAAQQLHQCRLDRTHLAALRMWLVRLCHQHRKTLRHAATAESADKHVEDETKHNS